ncbi:MAG: hypothetical protein ACRYFU_13020 [Janthinobacterium lividum]
MQAIEVVKTINWIRKQITSPMGDVIVGTRLIENPAGTGDHVSLILAATHDWSKTIEILRSHADAIAVLNAFGLSKLVDPEEPPKFAARAITGKTAEAHSFWSELGLPFNRMLSSGKSLETLVVPEELRSDLQPDDVLSITIREQQRVSLRWLTDTLEHIESIYGVMCDLSSVNNPKLEVVSIESGSPITLNLRGVGEVVKEMRLLLTEVWNRVRFKAQHEQLAKNSVLISTLQVMDEIEKRARAHTLSAEAAEQMKRSLTKGMFGLIDCHALPTEIGSVEMVHNDRLIETFSSKLLPSQTLALNASTSIGNDGKHAHRITPRKRTSPKQQRKV